MYEFKQLISPVAEDKLLRDVRDLYRRNKASLRKRLLAYQLGARVTIFVASVKRL